MREEERGGGVAEHGPGSLTPPAAGPRGEGETGQGRTRCIVLTMRNHFDKGHQHLSEREREGSGGPLVQPYGGSHPGAHVGVSLKS